MPGCALYWNDFCSLRADVDLLIPLVDDRLVMIDNAQLAERTGNIRFYSAIIDVQTG